MMSDKRVDDYKDLIVWKRSVELAKKAYAAARKLPREETFSLGDQIRRSAVSIPSNIAEGYGRTGSKEYSRFLSIARGSAYELETQLLLCVEFGYLQPNEIAPSIELIKEVTKILTVIIAKLGNG